eukprot:349608-Chlamydomonas_euryale.AAC.1
MGGTEAKTGLRGGSTLTGGACHAYACSLAVACRAEGACGTGGTPTTAATARPRSTETAQTASGRASVLGGAKQSNASVVRRASAATPRLRRQRMRSWRRCWAAERRTSTAARSGAACGRRRWWWTELRRAAAAAAAAAGGRMRPPLSWRCTWVGGVLVVAQMCERCRRGSPAQLTRVVQGWLADTVAVRYGVQLHTFVVWVEKFQRAHACCRATQRSAAVLLRPRVLPWSVAFVPPCPAERCSSCGMLPSSPDSRATPCKGAPCLSRGCHASRRTL